MKKNLESIIESILFVKGEPITFLQLSKIIEESEDAVKEAVDALEKKMVDENRGLIIVKNKKDVQLVTSPDNAEFIDKMIRGDLQDSLSKASLEVLSIIAYRGPVTRFDIDAIRGVNSSFILRNLLMRGLIKKKEEKNKRVNSYEVSLEFLKKLGVNNIKDLPDYARLSTDRRVEKISASTSSAKDQK